MTDSEVKKDTAVNEEPIPRTRKRSNSFASLLKKGTNMSSGIDAHLDVLKNRGVNEETIRRLDELVSTGSKLENEQEILKGQLKEKTSSLTKNTKEIKDLLSECTLIIKAVIPQNRWIDFGIAAKR